MLAYTPSLPYDFHPVANKSVLLSIILSSYSHAEHIPLFKYTTLNWVHQTHHIIQIIFEPLFLVLAISI
jgi:hypothetical protein